MAAVRNVSNNKGRPPLPDVWPAIAAGMAKGDRVVVKGAEEARALRMALSGLKVKYGRKLLLPPMIQRKRGEAVKLADGQYVVTQIGPVPLMQICGACAGASCAACTRGRVVGKRGAEQCECAHLSHIPLVGHGRSGYLNTGGMVVEPSAGPCAVVADAEASVVAIQGAGGGVVAPCSVPAGSVELRLAEPDRRAWVRYQMWLEDERLRGGRS